MCLFIDPYWLPNDFSLYVFGSAHVGAIRHDFRCINVHFVDGCDVTPNQQTASESLSLQTVLSASCRDVREL